MVRTYDSTGTQFGEILMAEDGATSMDIQGLQNGEAYRFQVAPPGSGSEPRFSELSEPVIPGSPAERANKVSPGNGEQATAGIAAEGAQPPPAWATPFGGVFGTAAPIVLAALGQYFSTSAGMAVLASTAGGLLAAAALLGYRLFHSRARARAESKKASITAG